MYIDQIEVERAVDGATPLPALNPDAYPDFSYSPDTGFPQGFGKFLKEKYERKFRKTAHGFARKTGLDADDLFAVVQLGAIRAATTYDRSRGAFWTYAQWQIRAHLNEYKAKNLAATRVRMDQTERRALTQLGALVAKTGAKNVEALSAPELESVAHPLGISAVRLLEIYRQQQPAISLHSPIGHEEGSATFGDLIQADPFGDHVGDNGTRCVMGGGSQSFQNDAEVLLIEHLDKTAIRAQGLALVRRAIDGLAFRERVIVGGRHGIGDPVPLAVFAERFDISVERVRQIEAKAIKKVKAKYAELSNGTNRETSRAHNNHARYAAELKALTPPKDELVCRSLPEGVVKVPLRHAVAGRFTLARETSASRPAYPSWGIGRQFDHIVAYRRHLEGAPTSNTFEARVRTQIAQTQKRTAAEQAERRARRMRAVAAGLSWAVQE
ncbi:sigma-70 family RNA polymerase sigma factor [Acidiphilium sp.]|uniref:sigma-70 family RNA polymerase sigma factor n=1 Tax=Acidiphilium sp. TaxID=527 RepID=UPI002588000F|nr:sigma-70 family RNA polymerase sigma factor [Acidiphilium sp.]